MVAIMGRTTYSVKHNEVHEKFKDINEKIKPEFYLKTLDYMGYEETLVDVEVYRKDGTRVKFYGQYPTEDNIYRTIEKNEDW